jgi:hypothetical protein
MPGRSIMPDRRKEGTAVERMRGKENHARQKEGGHCSRKDEREGESC